MDAEIISDHLVQFGIFDEVASSKVPDELVACTQTCGQHRLTSLSRISGQIPRFKTNPFPLGFIGRRNGKDKWLGRVSGPSFGQSSTIRGSVKVYGDLRVF